MAKMIFLDNRTFVSGADLSGWSNKIEVGEEWEDKKTTNFRSGGAESCIAGLGEVDISGEGQWEAGDLSMPDDSFWGNKRVIEPWSFGPTLASDTAEGNLMYLTSALRTKITLLDEVGNVAPWSADAKGSQPLVRGMSLHPSGTARSTTGNGVVVDMLAGPSAGQKAYANLHVLSKSGTTPNLTVSIQSATVIGFGSPTTRGSFAAATDRSGQNMVIASPGTDRYWRVAWTISGITPSFLFLVSLGFE